MLFRSEVVIDRLVKKEGMGERLADSLTTCLKRSGGIAIIAIVEGHNREGGKPQLTIVKNQEKAPAPSIPDTPRHVIEDGHWTELYAYPVSTNDAPL